MVAKAVSRGAFVGARMSSAGPHQSSSGGASSSSNIARANPSPPMTPLLPHPSTTAPSVVVRGRNRELQQLNNEIQLLEVRRYAFLSLTFPLKLHAFPCLLLTIVCVLPVQEELKLLDNIPPASKACKE